MEVLLYPPRSHPSGKESTQSHFNEEVNKLECDLVQSELCVTTITTTDILLRCIFSLTL